MNDAKNTVTNLFGVHLVVRLNEGRGKSRLMECSVEKLYPSVFTLRLGDNSLRTFSYSDVQTGKISFVTTGTNQLSEQ